MMEFMTGRQEAIHVRKGHQPFLPLIAQREKKSHLPRRDEEEEENVTVIWTPSGHLSIAVG